MHPVGLLPAAEMLAGCWDALSDGAASGRHPFHTCSLGSLGLDDAGEHWPELRTVVLRAVEPAAAGLIIHTDARSPKAAQIQANGRVALLFYDGPGKWQLRLRGTAELHRNTELARARWEASRRESRECYYSPLAPGSPTAATARSPEQPPVPDPLTESFALIAVTVTEMEALFLSSDGHRRFRFRPALPGSLPVRIAP